MRTLSENLRMKSPTICERHLPKRQIQKLTISRSTPTREGHSVTISGQATSVSKKTLHAVLRFLRRSGRYGSHISYEYKNPGGINNKDRKFSGWRGGVFAAATSTGIVLLMNLIFTIWAGSTSKTGLRIGTLYEGECGTVKHADSWLHIAINAMGTILLGASNFTMQCLSSPTRNEIDVAHSKGRYLDIGLPSLKNLNGWKKKVTFMFLVLSTLPLHFLWNSAVFTTTQNLDYNVFVVAPSFLNQSIVDCTQNVTIFSSGTLATDYTQTPLQYETGRNQTTLPSDLEFWQADVCNISKALLASSTAGTLSRLSNEECINAYGPGNSNMKGWSNLLAVTKPVAALSHPNNTILLHFRYQTYVSNYTGNNWICDPNFLIANKYKCNYKQMATNASSWNLGPFKAKEENPFVVFPSEEWPIDYCLAQQTDLSGKCQLQYSLVIMICVLVANAIKLSCMIFILRTHLEPVLATIGDAIASFLEHPDPFTVNRPFMDRQQARRFKPHDVGGEVRWNKPKFALRWWNAPSRPRWLITLISCIIVIAVVSFLLGIGNSILMDSTLDIISPYTIGFGTFDPLATLNIFANSSTSSTADEFASTSLLLSMVTVANLPQVIVSCLYFAYNTIYTSMVSADEFSRFSSHRKALRTTNPRGEQRSTYWLSLPWTYALPIAACSSVLHWLISQSLFIARTEVLDTYGQPESISFMEVGYSPLAILLALLFGSGMVLGLILNGLRKLKPCVLVGNNSLAIAAACQRPEKDVDAQLKKVQWGAVRHQEGNKPGHCCFTSEDVEPPRVGELYI
jgi:hypothetical protein